MIHVPARPRIECPPDMEPHVREVFGGCYDAGLDLETPTVLDIGANVGAFTVWALQRWPGAKVLAYEPNPAAFRYLAKNVQGHEVVAHQAAVRQEPGRALLKFGKNNLGEASFHDLGQQRDEGIEVEAVPARNLPTCDILKVDTEGDEVAVIRHYLRDPHRSPRHPTLVTFEFHSAEDRRTLDRLLHEERYGLVRGVVEREDRGVLCYVRRP